MEAATDLGRFVTQLHTAFSAVVSKARCQQL